MPRSTCPGGELGGPATTSVPAAASWPTNRVNTLPTSVHTTAVLMERVLTDPPLSDPHRVCPPWLPVEVDARHRALARIKTTRCGYGAPGAGDARLAVNREVDAVTTTIQTWITRTMILGALLVLCAANLVVQAPKKALAQAEPGTEVNVELVMDSSGSMAAETDTGEPRIDAAKRVLNQVIDAIPVDRPGLNVGFRVFGHLGDNTEAGRAESCQSSELTVPVDGVDPEALREQVANYQPVGWTPIGLSLERAAADFPAASDSVSNAIILVTDGLETCDADPCAIATSLKESEAAITVYVVGLGLDEEELRITSCIAENTGGQIVGAQNADELSVALFTFLEELEVVITTGFLEIESIGGLYPLATLTCAEQPATDSNPQGGEPFTYTFTEDTNRVEVPIGVCDLAWTNPSGNETTIQVNIEADRTTFVRGSLTQVPPRRRRDLHPQSARRHGDLAGPDRTGRLGVGPARDLQLRSGRTGRRSNPDLVHRPDIAGLRNTSRDLYGAIADSRMDRRTSRKRSWTARWFTRRGGGVEPRGPRWSWRACYACS